MSSNNERRKPARKPKQNPKVKVSTTAYAGGESMLPTKPVFGRPLFGYDHPGVE